MKVLLAVDGSPYTRRMLGYVAAHDELFRARDTYTVLTVVPPVPQRVARGMDAQALEQHYEHEARAVLRPVMEFAQQKHWPLNLLHRVGDPAEAIAEAAASGGYDLLVMGSHGGTGLRNVVLGSVVSSVLVRCDTPLLVVR